MTTRRTQRQPVSSRQVLDELVSESQLQRDVLEMAQKLGWLAYHVYDSRKSGPDKGFPDLILAKAGRVPIAAELKTERGHLSMAQRQWLAALGGSFEVHVWRPRDWSSGEIERVLMGAQQMGGAA